MANDSRYYGIQPTQQILQEITYKYTATAGQSSFAATYTNNYAIDVYYNGHRTTDYTATDFAHVVLNTPALAGALILIVTRPLVPMNAAALPLSGGTMSGPIVMYGGDTGVTPTAGDNSTKIPTTAFVDNAVASLPGAFKNLSLSATGTGAAVSVSYDALALTDGAGSWILDTAATGTITTTNTGAGGLDTGTLAASTWYSIWRIAQTTANGGAKSWLFSLSATAPTMPSGYTLKARIGWFRTDATVNKYPLSFKQYGRTVQYVVSSGSNVTGMPVVVTGSQGSTSTPTWVSYSISSFVPTTASKIGLVASAGASLAVIVAPNSSYGAHGSLTNPPLLDASGGSGSLTQTSGIFSVESGNIYYAANGSSCVLCVTSWEDNL